MLSTVVNPGRAIKQKAAKEDFIPLSKPPVTEEDIAVVNEVLRSGMLVQGEYVKKLEDAFAAYHNAKHAVAVANGTATLHLALHALGIGPGDEVIVPAFSYIATANVVELVGATCVFVDVDDRTFNIDVNKIEETITPRTKALIPVHQFGLACNIEGVCAIAAKHSLHVIEDAACALGAKQNGKPVGTFGVAGSFSLHPRKSITAGEGGVLLTDDDALAKRLRQLRNHGIETEGGQMDFVQAGYNYRLTDIGAALAWSQFQRLEKILLGKKAIAETYLSSIVNTQLTLPFVPIDRNPTWQTFHLLLNDNLGQQETITTLKELGIGSNHGAQCIPSQTHYRRKYGLDGELLFPNAHRAFTRGLAIPLFAQMTSAQAAYVSNALNRLS